MIGIQRRGAFVFVMCLSIACGSSEGPEDKKEEEEPRVYAQMVAVSAKDLELLGAVDFQIDALGIEGRIERNARNGGCDSSEAFVFHASESLIALTAHSENGYEWEFRFDPRQRDCIEVKLSLYTTITGYFATFAGEEEFLPAEVFVDGVLEGVILAATSCEEDGKVLNPRAPREEESAEQIVALFLEEKAVVFARPPGIYEVKVEYANGEEVFRFWESQRRSVHATSKGLHLCDERWGAR